MLLFFSYLFYLWGNGEYLLLLVGSTLVNYGLGSLVGTRPGPTRRSWLAAGIVFNLALLGYFKYANFFVAQLNAALSRGGPPAIAWTDVVLPLGISFFIFHNIIYLVEVSRGQSDRGSLVDFALYAAMFPTIIAGPIVRFSELVSQLRRRTETSEAFSQGCQRFAWGFIKKVIIATPCGEITDAVFALDGSLLDFKLAWLGALGYTLQIYFDFSGYCDMAIGLGAMFGFAIPENFNRPYSATSLTEFWRRWHMTLSRFFRDYVYIPLGGNRLGTTRTYVNLLVVFLLCGFWHGANWTFLVCGAYYGVLLIAERAAGLRNPPDTYPVAARRVVTLLFVVIGWVLFRATDLRQATDFLRAMLWPQNRPVPADLMLVLNPRNVFFLVLATLVVVLPDTFSPWRLLSRQRGAIRRTAIASATLVLLLYALAVMTSNSFRPDLYADF